MKKFEVIKQIEYALVKVGIYSTRDDVNVFYHSFVPYYILFNLISFALSCAAFIVLSASDFNTALRSAGFIVAASQTIGMFLSYGINASKIPALHFKLQENVDKAFEDGDEDSSAMYWANELKCRKFIKFFYFYGCIQVATFFTALIPAIFDICTGKTDTSAWDLPLNIVLPIDKKSVFGWLLYLFFQCSVGAAYNLSMILPMTHFACCCYYINASCDHFDLLINSLRIDCEKIRKEKNTQKHPKMWNDAKAKLQQTIEVHINIYKIFKIVAEIESGVIFSLLPLNVLLMSGAMYTIENSKFDAAIFVMDFFDVVAATIWPSLFCYFANLATDRVLELCDTVYALNWFDYPVEMQKFTILMIARSQERVHFVGLGLIACSLEAFAKLLKTTSSFYLLFRGLSQR